MREYWICIPSNYKCINIFYCKLIFEKLPDPSPTVACPPKVTPSNAFPELLKKSFTLLLLVPVGFSVVVFELDEVLEVVVLDAVVCSTGGLYSDKYEPATNACVPSACSMTNHNVSFPLYSVPHLLHVLPVLLIMNLSMHNHPN